MWAGMREMGRLIAVRWPGLAGAGGVAGVLWLLGFRLQLYAGQRRRERRDGGGTCGLCAAGCAAAGG